MQDGVGIVPFTTLILSDLYASTPITGDKGLLAALYRWHQSFLVICSIFCGYELQEERSLECESLLTKHMPLEIFLPFFSKNQSPLTDDGNNPPLECLLHEIL